MDYFQQPLLYNQMVLPKTQLTKPNLTYPDLTQPNLTSLIHNLFTNNYNKITERALPNTQTL
jgi:hypothetical protein